MQPEYLKFSQSKFRYYTFILANNKIADQTERMHGLVCALLCPKISRTKEPGLQHCILNKKVKEIVFDGLCQRT